MKIFSIVFWVLLTFLMIASVLNYIKMFNNSKRVTTRGGFLTQNDIKIIKDNRFSAIFTTVVFIVTSTINSYIILSGWF